MHIGITLAIHFVLRFVQKIDRWTEKLRVDDRYYIKICAATQGRGRINVEVALVATRGYKGMCRDDNLTRKPETRRVPVSIGAGMGGDFDLWMQPAPDPKFCSFFCVKIFKI